MVWGVRCRVLGAGVSAFVWGAGQDVVSFLAIEFFLHAESARLQSPYRTFVGNLIESLDKPVKAQSPDIDAKP